MWPGRTTSSCVRYISGLTIEKDRYRHITTQRRLDTSTRLLGQEYLQQSSQVGGRELGGANPHQSSWRTLRLPCSARHETCGRTTQLICVHYT
jgi:hypothetical protein